MYMRALCLTILLGTASLALAVCPNGVVEPPETCDDGNAVAGDGCSPLCLLEVPNLPPSCAGAFLSPDALWPPNHKLVPVTIGGVVDPDDDPVAITVTAIAQDEPVDGTGDGGTCSDATGVGTGTAAVRAERDGGGDGRVYHVAFRASDPSGDFCDGTATACVRHDNRRRAFCVDQGPLYDSTAGVCGDDDGDDDDHGDDGDDDDQDEVCHDQCLPPPPPPVDACEGTPVPRRIARRLDQAQRQMARAQDASPRAQRRLMRRAKATLARVERFVTARLSGACGTELGRVLDHAEGCEQCLDDHDDASGKDGDHDDDASDKDDHHHDDD
jgi:cysteine-rich repeat protein